VSVTNTCTINKKTPRVTNTDTKLQLAHTLSVSYVPPIKTTIHLCRVIKNVRKQSVVYSTEAEYEAWHAGNRL